MSRWFEVESPPMPEIKVSGVGGKISCGLLVSRWKVWCVAEDSFLHGHEIVTPPGGITYSESSSSSSPCKALMCLFKVSERLNLLEQTGQICITALSAMSVNGVDGSTYAVI